MNWPAWVIPVFAAALLVLVSAAVWSRLLLRMQREGFWEFQVRAFDEADRRHPPGSGAVVFTGSSSIRYWRTLDRDMAPMPVLNRGFGGCHLAHVIQYAERVVIRYRPRAVVLYAGENDLGWPSTKTPEAVLADFKRFVEIVRSRLPGTWVYFISLKLSPFRRGRWRAMREANRLVEEFARGREGVTFIDTSTAMVGPGGNPRQDLLPWYRLHMTAQGYKLWASIIKPILERDLGRSEHAEAGRGRTSR